MAKRRQPMSQINMVPLIDVMLVLLVVSMITVPLLNQGIEVNLPQDSAGPLEDYDEDPLVVTVRADQRIYVNVGVAADFDEEAFISFKEMEERTSKVLNARPNVPVFVRGDQSLDYGYVMKVMHALKEAGAKDVGLVTEPQETEP